MPLLPLDVKLSTCISKHRVRGARGPEPVGGPPAQGRRGRRRYGFTRCETQHLHIKAQSQGSEGAGTSRRTSRAREGAGGGAMDGFMPFRRKVRPPCDRHSPACLSAPLRPALTGLSVGPLATGTHRPSVSPLATGTHRPVCQPPCDRHLLAYLSAPLRPAFTSLSVSPLAPGLTGLFAGPMTTDTQLTIYRHPAKAANLHPSETKNAYSPPFRDPYHKYKSSKRNQLISICDITNLM